jgi:hypothetical protein
VHPADADALDGQIVAILTNAGRPCTAAQAGLIRGRILGRKKLRDPAAYVAAAVRKDPAAAFALTLTPPTPNGRANQPPPARELIAARSKTDPDTARRGAALARELFGNRPGTVKAEPAPDPEEFPF